MSEGDIARAVAEFFMVFLNEQADDGRVDDFEVQIVGNITNLSIDKQRFRISVSQEA